MTLVFGLTGGIASGKSAVSKIFAENGIPIVDADLIARQVVEPGTKGLQQVVVEFGPDIAQPDGRLDRLKLRCIVFSDTSSRVRLDQIMRPLIEAEMKAQEDKLILEGYPLVCVDAALIFEWGKQGEYFPLILVACSKETQISRLMLRNGLSQGQALAMIEAQMPMEAKVKDCNTSHVIWNDGTEEDLKANTLEVVGRLKETSKVHQQAEERFAF